MNDGSCTSHRNLCHIADFQCVVNVWFGAFRSEIFTATSAALLSAATTTPPTAEGRKPPDKNSIKPLPHCIWQHIGLACHAWRLARRLRHLPTITSAPPSGLEGLLIYTSHSRWGKQGCRARHKPPLGVVPRARFATTPCCPDRPNPSGEYLQRAHSSLPMLTGGPAPVPLVA